MVFFNAVLLFPFDFQASVDQRFPPPAGSPLLLAGNPVVSFLLTPQWGFEDLFCVNLVFTVPSPAYPTLIQQLTGLVLFLDSGQGVFLDSNFQTAPTQPFFRDYWITPTPPNHRKEASHVLPSSYARMESHFPSSFSSPDEDHFLKFFFSFGSPVTWFSITRLSLGSLPSLSLN